MEAVIMIHSHNPAFGTGGRLYQHALLDGSSEGLLHEHVTAGAQTLQGGRRVAIRRQHYMDDVARTLLQELFGRVVMIGDGVALRQALGLLTRSEEHTSELQSLR